MKRILFSLTLMAAFAMLLDSADARGSRGSRGSSGSSGSSGSWGSSGSSGSRGGSSGSRGSRGSHGSSGSSGSYGSSGSSGGSYTSYGSCGSSGGHVTHYTTSTPVYHTTSVQTSTPVYASVPADNCPNGICPRVSQIQQLDPEKARVTLHVPENAVVYLVNQKMSITGTVRQFNLPKLAEGKKYDYPIRVEITQDGKTHKVDAFQSVARGDVIDLVCKLDTSKQELTITKKEGQKEVGELRVVPTVNLVSK